MNGKAPGGPPGFAALVVIDAPGLVIDAALATLLVALQIQLSGRLPPSAVVAWVWPLAGLALVAVLTGAVAASFGRLEAGRSGWIRTIRLGASRAGASAGRHARLLTERGIIPRTALIRARLYRSVRFVACLLIATAFLGARIEAQLATRLDPLLEGQVIELDVMIDRIADRGGFGSRLLARVDRCSLPAPASVEDSRVTTALASPPRCDNLERVQLAWSLERLRDRDDEATAEWPQPGERWRLEGRARRPSAPVNPGSFDLELRLLEEGIGAIVRVRDRTRLESPGTFALWWQTPAIAIERWRNTLREAVEARVDGLARTGTPPWASLALVNALALGDQRGLPSSDWALFSRTGVSHLMAISGMHVTLLAWLGGLAFAAALKWLAARRVGPALAITRRLGRPRLVAMTTVMLAFGYALLSGWGIASQRTCWMLLVASLVAFSSRAGGPIVATVVATLPILLLDPWAVAAAGFWLSFGAVIAIIWQASGEGPPGQPLAEPPASAGKRKGQDRGRRDAKGGDVVARQAQGGSTERRDPLTAHASAGDPLSDSGLPGPVDKGAADDGRLRRVYRFRRALKALVLVLGTQWAATVALLPLTIALFASASVVGPLVNLFAIPWVSFIVTPAALLLTLTAAVPGLDRLPVDPWALAWSLLTWAIEAMMAALRVVDGWSLASVRIASPSPALLLAALLGAAWLLAPRGTGRRWLGWAGLLPLLFAGRLVPPPDQLRITAFDIGLGSAVLVETADARVLIDAGGGLPTAQAAGPASSTIVPALARRGIDRIDALVVSHRDREHSAGVATIVASLRPTWLISAFDPRWLPIDPAAVRWQACVAGERLAIGTLVIDALWPSTPAATRLQAGDNNRSCVIRLTHPAGALLAAGDLPTRQERRLLAQVRQRAAGRHDGDSDATVDAAASDPVKARAAAAPPLAAEVLIVPGQGSRSAAGEVLVEAVMPRLALIQTARAQRQRIVHPSVVERLEGVGARVLRTDHDGAVTVVLRRGEVLDVGRVRRDSPPYWRITDGRITDGRITDVDPDG